MLTRVKIGTRLFTSFGILVAMSIAVIGIGAFGLNLAVKSRDGITGRLIPVNVITADAREALKLACQGYQPIYEAARKATQPAGGAGGQLMLT